MTDREIIKALRCCASIASCYKCPFQTEMICRATLKSAAADRLEGYVDRCKRYADEIMELRERVAGGEADAEH